MMGGLLKNTLGTIIDNIVGHELRVIEGEWEQERIIDRLVTLT